MASPHIIITVNGEIPSEPGIAQIFNFTKISSGDVMVTLRLNNTVGVTAYFWELVSIPLGSTAVIDNPALSEPTFYATQSIPGTYLIRCTINGGQSLGTNAVAFRTENTFLRKFAFFETLEFGVSGWTVALNEIIDAMDALGGGLSPNAVLTDGTRTFVANQSMGGYKLVSLAAATVNGDAVRYEQWFDHNTRIVNLEAFAGGSIDHHTLINLDYEGDHPLEVSSLYEGNAAGILAYPSVGSAYSVLESSRVLSGLTVTHDTVAKTLTVSAGSVLLRSSDSLSDNPEVYSVPQKVFAYADLSDSIQWIVVTLVTGSVATTLSSNPGTYDVWGRSQLILGAVCSFEDPDNALITRVYYISFEDAYQDALSKRLNSPYRSESLKLYDRADLNQIVITGLGVSLLYPAVTVGDWKRETLASQADLTWVAAVFSGEGGGSDSYYASSVLDPTSYNDPVEGSMALADNGWFVCHYIFLVYQNSSDSFLISQYGNNHYSTIEEALSEKLDPFASMVSPGGLATYVGKVITRAPYVVDLVTILEGAVVAVQPANDAPQLFDTGSRSITTIAPAASPGTSYEILGKNRMYCFSGTGGHSYIAQLPPVTDFPVGGWVDILYKYTSMTTDDLVITPDSGDTIDWVGGSGRTTLTTITPNSKIRLTANGLTSWQASDGDGTWFDSAAVSITFEGGGPNSSTTNAIVTFADTTGSNFADSGVLISSLAPSNSPYWVSTAVAGLSAEVNLGALTTGLVKNTVSAGVSTPSTASPGTDYEVPLTFSQSISRSVNSVTLLNDAASPGNNKFYGVSRGGTKGFNTRTVAQHLTIGQAGSDVDYTDLETAVAAAIVGGAGTPDAYGLPIEFELIVYPGTYIVNNTVPIVVPIGINIRSFEVRVDTVFVIASNPNVDLFDVQGGFICGLNASGVTNALNCLFRINTAPTLSVLHSISIFNCSTGVSVSDGASCIITNASMIISGANMGIGEGIVCSGSGSYVGISGLLASVPSAVLPAYTVNPIDRVMRASDGAELYLSAGTLRVASKLVTAPDVADILFVESGATATVSGAEIAHSGNALHIGAAGSNSVIIIQGSNIKDNLENLLNDSSTGSIYPNISADVTGYTGVSGSVLCGIIQSRSEQLIRLIGNAKYQYLTSEYDVDLSRQFADYNSTGVSFGGLVSAVSGLNVLVTAGSGWIRRGSTNFDSKFVSWTQVNSLTLTDNATNYVVYDSASSQISDSVSPPGYGTSILLATIVTASGAIRFIHRTRNYLTAPMEQLRDYLLDTRKQRLKTGLAVVAGTGVDHFTIDPGSYYIGLDIITRGSITTDAYFNYFWGAGGANESASTNEVDSARYDLAGTRTAFTTGYFKADTVIVTSDGRVSVIYGTSEYATQVEAEAAPAANIPSFMEPTSFPLALLVIEQGVGIVSIIDIRPQGDSGSGTGTGGVSDHGLLSGLPDDDHEQYLLVSGSRAMSGDLQMGGQSITGVNQVDGVDVSAHKSRHDAGASDGLTTGVPAGLLVGNTSSTGGASSWAVSNHVHGVPRGTPSSIGLTNVIGSSTDFVGADHVHAHGNLGPGTSLHSAVTTSLNGFMISTDKLKLDNATATPTADRLVMTGAGSTRLNAWVDANVVGSGASAVNRIAIFNNTTATAIVDSGKYLSDYSVTGHTHAYEPVVSVKGNLTALPSGVLTVTGTAACLFANAGITITQAATGASGYLTSGDWNTFTNKVSGTYPTVVVDSAVAVWDTTSGKNIRQCPVTIGTTGIMSITGVGASVVLSGSTSGTTTIKSSAAPTSWTFNLPDRAGTVGQVLTASGSNVYTWSTPVSPGTGDVIWDSSLGTPLDGYIALFSGATGKLIKNSGQGISSLLQVNGVQTNTGAKTFSAATLKVAGAGAGVGTLAYASSASSAIQTFQAVGNGTTTGIVYCSGGQDVSIADGGTGVSSIASGAVYSDGTSLYGEAQLSATRGGTGNGTYVIGDILYASSTSALTRLNASTAGRYLRTNGPGTAPSWVQVPLTDITATGTSSNTTNTSVLTISGAAITYRTFNFHEHDVATANVKVGASALDSVAAGAGTSSGVSNTAVGYGSLTAVVGGVAAYSGSYNSGYGMYSGSNITLGQSNTCIGAYSLYTGTTCLYNTMIGDSSGRNVTGDYNIGIGSHAFYSAVTNTTGDYNIAVGHQAGRGLTSASHSIAIGNAALGKSAATWTTGNYNIAIGKDVMSAATTAYNNTIMGVTAATSLTTGYSNVIMGYGAGQTTIATLIGFENVIIGKDAHGGSSNASRIVAIGCLAVAGSEIGGVAVGYNASSALSGVSLGANASSGSGICISQNSAATTASDSGINIGCSSATATASQIRIGTSGVHTNFYSPTGTVIWTSSDIKLKDDIEPSELGLDFITALRPVSYRWIREKGLSSRKSFGFIAQEIQALVDANKFKIVDDPTIDNPDTEDPHLSLSYQDFIAPMVKAIQEQQVMIDQLRSELNALKGA
jgi:hypothetical protein